MYPHKLLAAARAFLEHESIRPDLGRACRATLGATIPLLLAASGWLPLNVVFVAIAAQHVAMIDVRGSYALRVGLLLAMTAILTAAAFLGGAVSTDVRWAVAAAGLVALCGGVWRHVIPDYGPPLAISSTLLFLISVSEPPPTSLADSHALSALAGGLLGVLLQIANWPIAPQHPLRRAVADSWVAVASLFEALAPANDASRAEGIAKNEAAVRVTLDHTYIALAHAKPSPLRTRLEELNLAAARLATRVVALNTALESALADRGSTWLAESLRPILTSLTNMSRSVAVTAVSRQPAHLAAFEVRLRRLTNLLRSFQAQTPARLSDPATSAHLREILRQIEVQLPTVDAVLRRTVDRAGERAAFSVELFDLKTWTLRPLASALNLNPHIDPALIRFTARVAALTMPGVAAFKLAGLPHGYWLPLTMVIVLQPDYGSTRERAAQRVLGTIAGSLGASFLLWLQLPSAALTAAAASTMFAFAYFLKRRYAVAVFFITLFIVLLTESNAPITVWFSVERITSTLVGGVVALVAALLFWPVWERDRLPPVLAAAIERNRDYLNLIAGGFLDGRGYDPDVVAAKRQSETANSALFSSLQRMMADPRNRQDGLKQMAALANGNQRLTRAFTVLAMHLAKGARLDAPSFTPFAARAARILAAVAGAIRGDSPGPDLDALTTELRDATTAAASDEAVTPGTREHAVLAQCSLIGTELGALLLTARESSSAQSG